MAENILDGIVEKIGNSLDLRSLQDRLDDSFENGVQVAAMPLAKGGTKIGSMTYKFVPPTGGHSARDIIRNDFESYPYKVFEPNVKYKDESIPGKYYIKGKDGSIVVISANSLKEARDITKGYNYSLSDRDWYTTVSNIKSSTKTKEQKEFDKAVRDVKNARKYNVAYNGVDRINTTPNMYRNWNDDLLNRRTLLMTGGSLYQPSQLTNNQRQYFVDFMDAKRRSKEAGHELARKFSSKNKDTEREIYEDLVTVPKYNVYDDNDNLVKENVSNKVAQNYVDENGGYSKPGTPSIDYTLGGQNHTFADNNANQSKYENVEFLRRNKRRIQYDKDGNPIVKGYHWTDKGNIAPIMKTGLVETIGPDSKAYGAMKGTWMSGNDRNPMYKNFFNGGIVGRGDFNEDLLEIQTPLKEYNRRLVTHDPMSEAKVDIFRSSPSDKGIMFGSDGRREYVKVPVPKEHITVHPEDSEYFKEWSTGLTVPGWHPNKKSVPYIHSFLVDSKKVAESFDSDLAKKIDNTITNKNPSEQRKLSLELMKNPHFVESYKRWKLSNYSPIYIDSIIEGEFKDPNVIGEQARLQHYYNNENVNPYQLSMNPNWVKNANGSIYKGENGKAFIIPRDYDDVYAKGVIEAPRTLRKLIDISGDRIPFKKFHDSDVLSIPESSRKYSEQVGDKGIQRNNFGLRDNYLYNAGIDPKEFENYWQELGRNRYKSENAKKGESLYNDMPLEDRLNRYKLFKSRAEAKKYSMDCFEKSIDRKNKAEGVLNQALKSIGYTDEQIGEMGYFTKRELANKDKEKLIDYIIDYNNLKYEEKYFYDEFEKADKLSVKSVVVNDAERMLPLTDEEKKDVLKDMSNRMYFSTRNDELRKHEGRMNAFRNQLAGDSLDRVIGHQLGRKIGKYRASRGKYGLDMENR